MKLVIFLVTVLTTQIVKCEDDYPYITFWKQYQSKCSSQIQQCDDTQGICNPYYQQYQKVLAQKKFQDYLSIVGRQTMQNPHFQDLMKCIGDNNYSNYLSSCGQKWLQFFQCTNSQLCINIYSNGKFIQEWNLIEQQTCQITDLSCQLSKKQNLISYYYSNLSQDIQQFVDCNITSENPKNNALKLSFFENAISLLTFLYLLILI